MLIVYNMKYPTLEQVENADREKLGEWCRFLPNPGWKALISASQEEFCDIVREETEIMDRIIIRFKEMEMFTPEK